MSKNKGKEILRFIKYGLIAASAGLIQIGTFALFNDVFKWRWLVGYIVSLVLSVIWNFTINRKYTFKSANNVPIAMLKVFAYYLVFTPLSTWLGDYLVETLLWPDYLVTIMNMLINFITEFLYQRYFVFGKSIDSAVKEKKTNSK